MTHKNLRDDPRVKKAKELILECLKEQQKKIQTIQPAKENLANDYYQTIEAFNDLRAGKLYFPYIGSGIGRGPLVKLLDGSVKFDMISGIGPHFWGHSHPGLIEAAIDGALENTVMQGHLQQNEEAFLISKLLCEASGLEHCFLTTSGAMACENALKICFQKRFPASRVLAFDHCFMGRSLALSQITDKPAYREGLPSILSVDYIPFYDPKEPEKSIQRTVEKLEEHIKRYPKQHAVLCAELIQGEGGFYSGNTCFFKKIVEILKREEILFFADEIQTFGRTPELFAFQYFNLQNEVDIVSIGKLSQTCATLFRANLKPRPGLLSQTFTSSSSALRASLWVIQNLLSEGYYGKEGKLAKLHQRFEDHFIRIGKQHPNLIEGPYGVGGMVAFTPFGGDFKKVTQFVQDLFQAGVISFTAGSNPTRVRFLIPAGAITLNEVDQVMQIVEQVLLKEV